MFRYLHQSRRHEGALVGNLGGRWWAPNKAPSPHKLKYETLYVSGMFVKFECPRPPAHTQSSSVDDFLATVLICTQPPAQLTGLLGV